VDCRADIWAFGVVLYEMLSGRQLFAGPTISDTLAAVLKTEPDFSALPAQLRRALSAQGPAAALASHRRYAHRFE
jgi:serine/threonine-protein kinase